MTTYIVREVGPLTEPVEVEAYSPMNAVSEVAECSWLSVGLPIWSNETGDCFFPRDNTGRQWLVKGKQQ